MSRRIPLVAALCVLTLLIIAPEARPGKDVEDTIRMESPAYEKHEEPIVTFTHKLHFDEYAKKHPKYYSSACGECHHDKDNKMLDNLKLGDEVQSCIECHKKPGYMKGKEAKGLSKEQKREYHANAIHDNCKGCHGKYNRANKLKKENPGYAPNTCKTCHIPPPEK